MTEQSLQQEIRLLAAKKGHSLWRNNNGAFKDEKNRWIRFGLGNDSKQLNEHWKSSDLIGMTNDGRFLAVEVKKPNWRLTDGDKRAQAQANFMNSVRSLGGRAGFAQSIEDFERILEQ